MVSQAELEQSIALQKLISGEDFVDTPGEELKKNAIVKLKEIVTVWIRRVAYQRRLPKEQIKAASATILTYRSYGLGVHDEEPEIEALCVGPCFASMAEDFFIALYNILAGRPEVSGIHLVKDESFPLMRFVFDGILIDFPYVKLPVASVPENVDVFDPMFVTDLDEASLKGLSGARAKNSILPFVPDVKIFEELLHCLKLWAKRRGVYGNLFGFFSGAHLAVLAAFICQQNPSASLVSLISIFFKTFAYWPWPKPIALQEEALPSSDPRALIPIQSPGCPHEYCPSNITTSTFNKIRAEFRRGFRYSQDLSKPQFDWKNLFDPFPYAKTYLRFIKICLSASNQNELGNWAACVKSCIRNLLVKLEDVQALCDPNPTEYTDTNTQHPVVVFYWGLVPGKGDRLDLNPVREDFMRSLRASYQGDGRRLTLTLTFVPARQLSKNLEVVSDQMRARSKFLGFGGPKTRPVYSAHFPGYVVGYRVNSEIPM